MKRKKKILSLNRENIRLLDVVGGVGRRSFQLSRCYCSDENVKTALAMALQKKVYKGSPKKDKPEVDLGAELAKKAGIADYKAFAALIKYVTEDND